MKSEIIKFKEISFIKEELDDIIEQYKFLLNKINRSPIKWLNDTERRILLNKLIKLKELQYES